MNTFIIYVGIFLISSASDLLHYDFTQLYSFVLLRFLISFHVQALLHYPASRGLFDLPDHTINLRSIAPEDHDHSNSLFYVW